MSVFACGHRTKTAKFQGGKKNYSLDISYSLQTIFVIILKRFARLRCFVRKNYITRIMNHFIFRTVSLNNPWHIGFSLIVFTLNDGKRVSSCQVFESCMHNFYDCSPLLGSKFDKVALNVSRNQSKLVFAVDFI